VTRPPVLAVAALVAVLLAGCGRSARDGSKPAALPSTTPVASDLAASVADTATAVASSGAATTTTHATAPEGTSPRFADLRSATIEQRGGALTVRITLAHPLDASLLHGDEQIAVGAYLLASPDDADPYAARLLLDAGQPPRFLFGPWLGRGRRVDGSLEGAELTLRVSGLAQGRFRYAQFFAEDPSGGETLPDDETGMVAINAR
jgi:hypothetical protein